MVKRYTTLEEGKEMDITTVPTFISQLYKNRSLEGKKIFAHSLPMKKLILGKRFHLHPYFHNRLGGFHNDRSGKFSAKKNNYGIRWNLLDILITWMKKMEANITKQRINDKYNKKYGPSYPFKMYEQQSLSLCLHPFKCQ
jgi:hypothetical protein